MKIKEFLIDEECSMLEAMELLDKVAKKVLFITKQDQLIAAITDGDIRRWILKKGNLDAKVKDVANYSPIYIFEKDKLSAREYMKKHSVEALPIVDENRHILSILFWDNEEISNRKKLDVPIVIMAGGLGTRLYPYTKILPKPLIPIGEIPIVEHIINRFNREGSNDFYLIINHKKNMIKAYFNEINKSYKITYIDEEKPLGTGGGLSLLKGKIKSTFILSNCDILIKEDYEKMYSYHKIEKNLITMICSLKKIKIPYGVVEIGENGEIESMTEKPELSFFTNTGMYIVESKIIEEMSENRAIDFPDIIEQYKNAGEKIGVYPISANAWMDMGQLDEMEEMSRRLEQNE
ncbi:NTP transferase domain-containing protein [Acetobacterium fimetarium]|uniref:NTP transferase domain-containing protein n=1 Tax=Acetobacterium fimetarium TaxID=52691 RepID=A0ABR6WWL4_9FIRM|nr:sugar phosphate nucleotidyltransferase [Acetobacterium fimetarium]MBC3805022.1 NTP transferase domain-containing protein [Acetobacterium fimetarium]